jgi:hypothetical protein
MRRMDVHGGAILAAASDGARIVSGGDDGEVVTTDLGSSRVLGADAKHRWIDHCHEECELQRLGFDRAQLPLRQHHMLAVDQLVTERVLCSDDGPNASDRWHGRDAVTLAHERARDSGKQTSTYTGASALDPTDERDVETESRLSR